MKIVVQRFLILVLLHMPLHTASAETIENYLGMHFVTIPAGEFTMGTDDLVEAAMELPDPDVETIRDESPPHKVIFNQPFNMGQTEVTQAQWLRIMENKPGPEAFWAKDKWQNLPVVSVSWFMARLFTEELSKMDKDYHYRLPTEAEWEYAARGGTTGLRPWPEEDLEDYAWFIHNSGDEPQPVATRKPNDFGLYDMIGSVWEWTADWYAPDSYKIGSRVNPQGPETGERRVRRGGSYHCPLHLTRVGYRSPDLPGKRYSVLGFRVIAEKK